MRTLPPIRARGYFVTLLGVGGLLAATVGYGTAQSYGMLRSIPARLAASCDCSSAVAINSDTFVAGIVSVTLLALFVVITAVRILKIMRTTAGFLRGHHEVPPSRQLREAALIAGVATNVHEIDSRAIVAFCAGLRTPRLYVSSGAVAQLDRHELRALLEHERHHLVRRDPLRLLVAELAAGIAWFVPGARATLRNFRTSIELDADRTSIERTGTTESLGSALVKALEGSSARAGAHSAVTFFAITDRRIEQLLGETARLSRTSGALFMIVGLVVSAGLLFATNRAVASEARQPLLNGGQCQVPPDKCTAPHVFWSSFKSTALLRSTPR